MALAVDFHSVVQHEIDGTSGSEVTVPSGETWKVSVVCADSTYVTVNGTKYYQSGSSETKVYYDQIFTGGDTLAVSTGTQAYINGFVIAQ